MLTSNHSQEKMTNLRVISPLTTFGLFNPVGSSCLVYDQGIYITTIHCLSMCRIESSHSVLNIFMGVCPYVAGIFCEYLPGIELSSHYITNSALYQMS